MRLRSVQTSGSGRAFLGPIVNLVLCASIGCFTGLVVTLLMRSTGYRRSDLDALLGLAADLLTAWFIAPISEVATGSDNLNIAAIVAAVLGGVVLVALAKIVSRR